MEYGCGPANTAFILAMNGFFVDAFDYQSKVLDFQKSRERKNLHYYNLEEYKQNNIQYDAVVCFEVFEHIEDPRLIIDSLNNHLKDKGYLFTTFSSEVGLSNINKDPEHICKLSNQEIFNYIISLGYKKINKIILPNSQSVDTNYPLIFQKGAI